MTDIDKLIDTLRRGQITRQITQEQLDALWEAGPGPSVLLRNLWYVLSQLEDDADD